MFSPWSELISPAAKALLTGADWTAPPGQDYPTGHEWADHYLDPLAKALGDRVRYGQRVAGVAKHDRDLLVDGGRDDQSFVVIASSEHGTSRIEAKAVIDASGTTGSPNPLAADGYPAMGEEDLRGHLRYGTPDPAAERERYAGRAVAVVGSGASALTALIALTPPTPHTGKTVDPHPMLHTGRGVRSRVVWVIRRGEVGGAFGGGSADELPRRGALGMTVHAAVDQGLIEVVTGFRIEAVRPSGDGVALVSSDGQRLEHLDEVIVTTGYRPDHAFLSEVRLDLDPRLQAPRALAPSIDPNKHSCGSVAPHGFDVLQQEDPGLFLAGMKSYGRASSFLAMVGFEQVRSIAAAISGDLAAARAVVLSLPDTGVCGGAGLFDSALSLSTVTSDKTSVSAGCCAP